MSIRQSMYRTVSILILVPFLLFSLIVSYIYTVKLEGIITDSLHSVANEQVAEMTDFCEQQMKDLMIIGGMNVSHAALRGKLDEKIHPYLDGLLHSRVEMTGYLAGSAMIDTSFRVVACSETEYAPYASRGIDRLVEKLGDRQFYISDVIQYSFEGEERKSVVALARIEEAGDTLGYALAEINLDFYNHIRERAELWSESTFYLLDGDRQIISAGTYADGRDRFVTAPGEREDYNRKYNAIDFEKNPQGSFLYRIGGSRYITYYSAVKHTDWRVLLSVNVENYLAQRSIYIVLVICLAALCAVLAVWIGTFTSSRIVRPIQRISDTLGDIQRTRDYSLRVEVHSRDELGQLSREIDALLDFTEQQQLCLQEKAETDALTKVLNKGRITQYLREAVESHRISGTQLAVLFADIDDFKSFNTDYGHSTGDQVLLFIASLLGRETNGTVGRAGGDEFLAVVEDPEKLAALDACLGRIRELAESRFVTRGSDKHLPVYCCIGAVRVDCARPEARVLAAEELIRLADAAMYRVKKNGKHGHLIRDWDAREEN